jgi:hypothetical protein
MKNTKSFGKIKRIHFVGVGGIGMSGIAELLLNLGYQVSGSDLKTSSVTRRLAQLGGDIFIGHRKDNMEGADVVVYSSAVPADNPELMGAREKYVPVIPRGRNAGGVNEAEIGLQLQVPTQNHDHNDDRIHSHHRQPGSHHCHRGGLDIWGQCQTGVRGRFWSLNRMKAMVLS